MDKHYDITDQSYSPAGDFPQSKQENEFMTLGIAFILLWILGLGLGFSMSGFIHILLVSAAFMFLIAFAQSRFRP